MDDLYFYHIKKTANKNTHKYPFLECLYIFGFRSTNVFFFFWRSH